MKGLRTLLPKVSARRARFYSWFCSFETKEAGGLSLRLRNTKFNLPPQEKNERAFAWIMNKKARIKLLPSLEEY